MATIVPRKGKQGTSYRAVVRIRGARAQTKTFRRKTDAKRWAISTEASIREGRHLPENLAQRRTIGELVDRFVAEILPTQGPKDHRVADQLKWWVDRLGAKTSLAEVTPGSDRRAPRPVGTRRLTLGQTRLARDRQALSGDPVPGFQRSREGVVLVGVQPLQPCPETEGTSRTCPVSRRR